MRSEIIHNKNLDRIKWDEFTSGSADGHIFNLTWYLDVVFPEWQGLIVSEDDEWVAILPLFPRKKYGFNICLQPLLIRYTGIIKKNSEIDNLKIQNHFKDALSEFRITKFSSLSEIMPEKYLKRKVTYKLDISLSYKQIHAGFKGSLRNKLTHFNEDELTIQEEQSAATLIQLYRHYADSGKFKVTNDYYDTLQILFEVASEKKMARIITARNNEMQPISAMLFFYFEGTVYVFIGLTHQDYRKTAIHPFLIAKEIKDRAVDFKKLDFLGSMIPGVAKFNRSFGAEPYTYFDYCLKKFPFNLLPI